MASVKEAHDYVEDYIFNERFKSNYLFTLSRDKKEVIILNSQEYNLKEYDISFILRYGDKFNNIIKEFNDIINKDFNKYNVIYSRNIDHLNIMEYKFNIIDKVRKFFGSKTTAFYDMYDNSIHMIENIKNEETFRRVVMHELLHMASSYEYMFSGVSQDILIEDKYKTIAHSINEGFTEYINSKYFSKVVSNTYRHQVQYTYGISRIIGDDRILDNYFNKGLSGLVRDLSSYISKNEAIDLILDIDKIYKKYDKKLDKQIKYKISNIYLDKLNNDFTLNKIDQYDYDRNKFLFYNTYLDSDRLFSDNTKIIEYNNGFLIKDNKEEYLVNKALISKGFNPDSISNDNYKAK